MSPQQKSYFERGLSSSSCFILFTEKREMGVAFCQEPDGPGVPSCLPPASLLGASYVQDRTGAPRPAAQKQKPARRVSVDGREACVPCEQAEVLSGYPDSTGAEGGGPGRRQRFRSDTHELDFRGTCEPECPRPEDRSRVLTQEAASAAPSVRDCEPCAFGTAFVISYTWSRGANPELVN